MEKKKLYGFCQRKSVPGKNWIKTKWLYFHIWTRHSHCTARHILQKTRPTYQFKIWVDSFHKQKKIIIKNLVVQVIIQDLLKVKVLLLFWTKSEGAIIPCTLGSDGPPWSLGELYTDALLGNNNHEILFGLLHYLKLFVTYKLRGDIKTRKYFKKNITCKL